MYVRNLPEAITSGLTLIYLSHIFIAFQQSRIRQGTSIKRPVYRFCPNEDGGDDSFVDFDGAEVKELEVFE